MQSDLFDAAALQDGTLKAVMPMPSLRVSRELEMGKAAEHLVCADLLLSGWSAFPTSQGMPYDLIVDTGRTLVRVQVKSTLVPKTPSPKHVTPFYLFTVRRAGKGGRRLYQHGEFDVTALVALDRRLIAYFASTELPGQTAVIRVPGLQYFYVGACTRTFEGATFERALSTLGRPDPVHAADGAAFDTLVDAPDDDADTAT